MVFELIKWCLFRGSYMNRRDIAIYGALVEGDIFEEGYGTTEQDEELLLEASKKIYGVISNSSEEYLKQAEKEIKTHLNVLVKEYREKAKEFLHKHGEENTVNNQ